MNRSALVIECSSIPGQDFLPGAKRDAAAWHEFLYSNRGGAWRQEEITVLANPTAVLVRSKLAQMSGGYSFVAFSGHGFVRAQGVETVVCLHGSEMSERELTPKSSRATVVMDSCRGLLTEDRAVAAVLRKMAEAVVDRAKYRAAFDTALERAEEGACLLYGCDFNQSAQETKAGGDFTQGLIQAAGNWTGKGSFSIRDAFQQADKYVRQRHPQQTPQSQFGRRLNHFPLAVEP